MTSGQSRNARAGTLLRALGVLAAGALLVGCSHAATPPTTTSATTTSTAASSSTSTSTASVTSTTALVASACSTALLSAAVTPGGSAAGTAYETVTLTNDGPNPCSVSGYAVVAFFGPTAGGGAGAGPKLDVTVQDGGPAPSPYTVAPKAAAAFIVLYSDVPAGGVGCSTVASLTVGLPGGSESLGVPASMTLCGGSVRLYPFAAPGSESP